MNSININEIIGEKVFGLKGLELMSEFLPNFSTKIKDAWLVVDKFDKADFGVIRHYSGIYTAGLQYWDRNVMYRFESESATAPMAICLVVLKSIGIEVEEAVE